MANAPRSFSSYGAAKAAPFQDYRALSNSNAQAERILGIEDEFCFGVYVRSASDAGVDLSIADRNSTLEYAAHDTLLLPDLTFFKLSIRVKTG